MDPFVISGNSLGAKDWDGRSNQWYTGSGDSGHWEDINCGAHFKYDLNNYLNTAGTKYRNVQVCRRSVRFPRAHQSCMRQKMQHRSVCLQRRVGVGWSLSTSAWLAAGQGTL